MTTVDSRDSYHHGDLRATLLTTAMGMLESGEAFSLRGLAREAGVSATAPYRHFKDRDALESALAAQGLRDLREDLVAGREVPASVSDLADLAVGYVRFALARPALFRVMFGNACDTGSEERVAAAGAIHDLLAVAMTQVFPDADAASADALATAGWGLAHGLAMLHLDGKMQADSLEAVDERVRGAFTALVNPHG